MKILLNRKEINKSLLTDGITLPKDIYDNLYSILGRQLSKGEKIKISIVIDSTPYEASVYYSNADRNDVSIQFRWNMNIGSKMRSLFTDSKPKLVTKDGGAVKGKTQPITEYVNIIATNPHTYMFDCHYKLTDVEYALCKENFNCIAAAKAKPFLILGGFSGTGKSQKVKELAFLTCPELDDLQKGQDPGNYCLISVKPNWHDSTELLGYYSNIGRKYVCTEFMKFIVKAMKYPLVPFFVCMDEMNLAPVEEYFAEYLSVLESRKSEGGRVVSSALVSSDIFTRTYEDFYKFLGTKPYKLGVVSRLYPELTASYLTESLRNIFYQSRKSGNRYQSIDSMYFEWEVETNYIKRVEFAAVPEGDGADGTEITMAFKERYYEKYDISVFSPSIKTKHGVEE